MLTFLTSIYFQHKSGMLCAVLTNFDAYTTSNLEKILLDLKLLGVGQEGGDVKKIIKKTVVDGTNFHLNHNSIGFICSSSVNSL